MKQREKVSANAIYTFPITLLPCSAFFFFFFFLHNQHSAFSRT